MGLWYCDKLYFSLFGSVESAVILNPMIMRPNFRWFIYSFFILALSACSSGAVVFAPTQPPPDVSPALYRHPGGAFSLMAPRNWPVYEENTTVLATAAFSAPDDDEPSLTFAVINLGSDISSDTFAQLINQYQTQIRPDAEHYSEQNRQAMGDGSWRLTGLRTLIGGITEQVNTFIERSGSLFGVIEVVIPPDPARLNELQNVVNSFTLNNDAPLQATQLSTLTFAKSSSLAILHVSTWTTASGVFFITGEIANYGGSVVTSLPVTANLRTADGLVVAQAVDAAMGYGILPGGFAPFSLRFGQGQPALTTAYDLTLGGGDWQPDSGATIYGSDHLSWTDDSSIDYPNRLVISGSVVNSGAQPAYHLRAMATVFGDGQNVIAAGFVDLIPDVLQPGESAPYEIVVPEMGGTPANYIVTIQALPA